MEESRKSGTSHILENFGTKRDSQGDKQRTNKNKNDLTNPWSLLSFAYHVTPPLSISSHFYISVLICPRKTQNCFVFSPNFFQNILIPFIVHILKQAKEENVYSISLWILVDITTLYMHPHLKYKYGVTEIKCFNR